MSSASIDEILNFWFDELTPKDWFRKDEEGKAVPNADEQKRIKTHLARAKDFRAQIDEIEEARNLLQQAESAREAQTRSALSGLQPKEPAAEGGDDPGPAIAKRPS